MSFLWVRPTHFIVKRLYLQAYTRDSFICFPMDTINLISGASTGHGIQTSGSYQMYVVHITETTTWQGVRRLQHQAFGRFVFLAPTS